MIYEVGFLGSGWLITAPVGFETDLASVPILPRWSPRWLVRARDRLADQLARAAIPHDLCRSERRLSKIKGDLIFLEAMAVDNVPRWIRWPAFVAVVLNQGRA